MNRLNRLLGVGGLALGCVTIASAETFNYEAFGGVQDAPYQTYNFPGTLAVHDAFEDFATDPRDPNGAHAGVSWGDPEGALGPFGGKSGIGFRPVVSTVEADGDPVEFGTLVHFNEPVYFTGDDYDEAGNDVTLSWNLMISHGTDEVFNGNFQFSLYQWETLNATPCARSTAGTYTVNGHSFLSDGDNQTVCDDAFTFQALDATPIAFSHDGVDYLVKILGWYQVALGLNETTGDWTYSCTDIPAGTTATPTLWSPEDNRNAACVKFKLETVPAQRMYVDIKPTSCPNPINSNLNPRSRAVLPAAILGTADFDVADVDPQTVQLCLGDNCVSPVRWSYGLAAAPYDGEPCVNRMSCTRENDGIVDLELKFGYNEVLDTLGLRGLEPGQLRCLTIKAMKSDGSNWEGQDIIWINRSR